MVAITVILAAVIASFVLGMGDTVDDQPKASFSFNYEEGDTPGEGNVTIKHEGGDTIRADELYVRGSGITATGDYEDLDSPGSWDSGSAAYDADSEIKSGNRLIVGVTSDYDIDVVWEAPEGDSSATLQSDSGPDA